MKTRLASVLLATCALGTAHAYDADLSIAGKVGSLAVIGVPFGLHKAGNIEIAVTGGFANVPGLTCSDRTYLTTLASTDPDGQLFNRLLQARWVAVTGRVTITVTDDPALTAYPGRCSIKSIQM